MMRKTIGNVELLLVLAAPIHILIGIGLLCLSMFSIVRGKSKALLEAPSNMVNVGNGEHLCQLEIYAVEQD